MKTFDEIIDFLSIEVDKIEKERESINSGDFAMIDKLNMMNILDGKSQQLLTILNFFKD